jgi:hypothetical protein
MLAPFGSFALHPARSRSVGPYGYRRVYDSRTRALIRQEPDPETAPIVQELARRVLAGEAFYALTIELNARGVPSPETIRMRRLGNTSAQWVWRQDQVRDVVLSPTSAGRRVHRGVVLDGVIASWEPLISQTDHALLVEKLCDPGRRSWKDGRVKHLLTGLAFCGVCGAPVRRTVNNRDKYANYCCNGGPGKFCVARKQQWVDDFVTDVVIERLSQPDALDVYATEGSGLQEARHTLVALEAELATLRAAKKEGRISLQAFLDFEPDLLGKIETARARLLCTAAPPVLVDLVGGHVRTRWEQLTIPQRRDVIRALCIVNINPTRQGGRQLDPSTIMIDWKPTQRTVPDGITGRRSR